MLALIFLALHLPYLPASLEDLDSVNFALGLRHFDVAHHQPHPPGYPVYIAAGRIAHALIPSEAKALALVGVLAGALGVAAFARLFAQLADESWGGWTIAATAIAITSPLYWFTAARPLSDAAGLAAAVAIQALTMAVASDRGLAAAAFCAGVAAGIRSQVAWLTVPLIAYRVVSKMAMPGPKGPGLQTGSTIQVPRVQGPGAQADSRSSAIGSNDTVGRVLLDPATVAGAFVAGVLVWFVPLVALTGGPSAYWRALINQGAEDLTGITMLWTTPTPRVLVDALYYAFVAPWAVWPVATVVLLCAAVGVWTTLRRERTLLLPLAVAFGPYLLFDILFQETFTGRYALPLVVPVALLATAGLRTLPQNAALVVAGALVVFDAHVGGRSIAEYSRRPAPAFRLLQDMRSASAGGAAPPVYAPDRRQSFDLRRPLIWLGDGAPLFDRTLSAPPQHEWLQAVRYWDGGGRSPVWFVVDPRRAAMELVQHAAPAEYRWFAPYGVLLSGTRPSEADWYRVDEPDWYAREGWSLTPESAGVAQADRKGLEYGPISAAINRRAAGGMLMFGGRSFDPASRPRLTVQLGGSRIADITAAAGGFLAFGRLPPDLETSRGGYADLVIAADPPGRVAIEQFDASSARPLLGFGDGWQEPELNPSTGSRWRWLSDRGELRYVAAKGSAFVLHMEGESPRRYYSRGSRLVVKSGDTVLKDVTVSDDFAIDVVVPAAAQPSTLVVETDQTHVPAESRWRRSNDRRRLGLRIFKCELRPFG